MIRLDLFLKHSKLIKRRTVAKYYCDRGLVLVNDRVGKPSTNLKDEDIVEITIGKKNIKIKVELKQLGKTIYVGYDVIKITDIDDKGTFDA